MGSLTEYPCGVCNTTFTDLNEFMDHGCAGMPLDPNTNLNDHRPFNCQHCEATFFGFDGVIHHICPNQPVVDPNPISVPGVGHEWQAGERTGPTTWAVVCGHCGVNAKDLDKKHISRRVCPKRPRQLASGAASPPLTRDVILAQALELTMGDRNKDHGDPVPNMEEFATLAKVVFAHDVPPAVGGALIMVLYKLVRCLRNPQHMDSYVDMAAYAAIAGEAAQRAQK